MERERANELVSEASQRLVEIPSLRLGQALFSVAENDELDALRGGPLFDEECPIKAMEIFYSIVDNGGKRELTGKLKMGKLLCDWKDVTT